MLNRLIIFAGAVALLGGCGSTPSTSPSSAPAAVITIGTSGVNTKSVTVPRGSQVQFINNDTTSHEIASNPHPEHTDCPEINSVGFLSPGQSRLTGNLNTARTCGYHDHNNPNNTALQGSITVQ